MNTRISDYLFRFNGRVDTLLKDESTSTKTFFKHFSEGKISFIHSEDNIDKEKQEFLVSIKKSVKYLNKIAEKPKQHLKVEELFRAVELTRRINPRTVFELSRNSQHWDSRTVNEIKPSKLLTELAEDELAIYENLALKTLVDDLMSYIDNEVYYTSLTIKHLDNASLLYEYFQRGYRVTQSLKKLLGSKTTQQRAESRLAFYHYLNELKEVQSKLKLIMNTTFYMSLTKTRRVQSPLQPTNIFIENSNYRVVYRLWNELIHFRAKNDTQKLDPAEQKKKDLRNYLRYVYLLLTYTFYEPKEHTVLKDSPLMSDSAHLALSGSKYKIEFSLNEDSITIKTMPHLVRHISIPMRLLPLFQKIELPTNFSYQNEDLLVNPNISSTDIEILKERLMNVAKLQDKYYEKSAENKNKGRNRSEIKFLEDYSLELEPCFKEIIDDLEHLSIQLIPDIEQLEKSHYELEMRTQKLLDNAVQLNNKKGIDSIYYIIPDDILDNSETPLAEKLVRRLNSIGESFIEEIEKDNAEKWGDYKAGILLVSPLSFLSPIRLLKAVNASIFRLRGMFNEMKKECYACHSPHISEDISGYRCKICEAQWSMTKCGFCEDTFTYLDLNDADIKKRLSTDQSLSILEQTQLYEALRGEKAITQKRVLHDNSSEKIKLVSICPKCGNKGVIYGAT